MSISFVSVVVLATLLGMGTYTWSQQTSDTTDRVCSYSLTSPSDVDGRCPNLKQAVGCRERTDVTDDDAVREEIGALKTSLQSLRDKFEEWKRDCPCHESSSSSPVQAFHVRSPEGRYKLNFAEAAAECIKHSARMASYDDLYAAWENGLDVCQAGWLSDGSVRYPIQRPRTGCGSTRAIQSWGFPSRDNEYDVYCIWKLSQQATEMSISFVSVVVLATLLGMGTYTWSQQTSDTTDRVCSYSLTSPSDVDGRCPNLKQAVGCRERTDVTDDDAVREEIGALKTSLQSLRDKFEEWKRDCPCHESSSSSPVQAFHVRSSEGRYKLNFAEAAAECIKSSARMASYEDLYVAWKNGLDVCQAGWLSDGSVRFPIQTPRNGCGSTKAIQSWGFPSRDNEYDVYCILNFRCQ
ncbi:aggrecan core protein-like [Ptychodera flava]|uniref:aggrecan core protein-like n=1 Tax=Ptychodera flava TaxID=63121 RepID=UPI003969DB92